MYDLNLTLRSANCRTHGQIGSVKSREKRPGRVAFCSRSRASSVLPLPAKAPARAHTHVRPVTAISARQLRQSPDHVCADPIPGQLDGSLP
jgi:hypothetical protein